MMQKPQACDGCPFRSTGIGFAPGRGVLNPLFTVIAEMPGKDEISSSDPQPLIGPTGRIFNRALYENGIDRNRLYLTNVLKCQAPGNILPKGAQLAAIVHHCTNAYLRKELTVIQSPTLAMGTLAFHHLTGKDLPILTYRGYPIWSERYNRWIIGTIHPAFIFKTATGSADKAPPGAIIPAIQSDIRKVSTFSHPDCVAAELHPSEGTVRDTVEDILDKKLVAVDIETPGHEKDEDEVFSAARDIHIIGVSSRDNHAVVCHPEHFHLLAPIFDPRNQVVQIGQNYVSDLLSLSDRFSFDIRHVRCEDIMLMFHALFSDLPKRLSVIASFFTRYQYWKLSKKDWKTIDLSGERFLLYNAYDAAATWMCYQAMKPLIEQQNLTSTYHAMLDLTAFAAQMFSAGCNVNVNRAMQIELEHIRVNQKIEEAFQLAIPGFNLNSPQQMMELLYVRMGLQKQYKKSKGEQKLTSDAEALDKLQKLYPQNKTLGLLQIHRENRKTIEYVGAYHTSDERIHSSLKITGTTSGRLESRNPNVMQQPDVVREIYIADAECDEI